MNLVQKLGLEQKRGFASFSNSAYDLKVFEDQNKFIFKAGSLDLTYIAESKNELLVEARNAIREVTAPHRMLSESRHFFSQLPEGNARQSVYQAGAVKMVALRHTNNMWTISRENKMVSSHTDLSRDNNNFMFVRQVGLHPESALRLTTLDDALHLFLSNFESARIPENQYKESVIWTLHAVTKLEGLPKMFKPSRHIDRRQSGMLARPVKVKLAGEDKNGILLTLRSGRKAEVLIENEGKKSVDKHDIWID